MARYYEITQVGYKCWSVVLKDRNGKEIKVLKAGFRVRMDGVRWGRENGIKFSSNKNRVEVESVQG
jgi:hypothetical protein